MSAGRNSLIRKIKALLNKTTDNGCTEAEMMAALAMARALMDDYEVTDADLHEAAEDKATISGEEPSARDPLDIKNGLCQAVAAFCDCRAWVDVEAVQFCGLRVDVELAHWLLATLDVFVQDELQRYMIGNLYVGTRRRRIVVGFATGCTDRIRERLYALVDAAHRAASKNSHALVVVKTDLIDRAMKDAGIALRDVPNGRRRLDDDGYQDGRDAGERATFGRPVDGSNAVLRIGRQ
jgi:hypothetical protein